MSKSPRLTKADETDEFREFWSLWQPKARDTDGRGLARETFFKHVEEGADPRDIVDGARCFLRTLKDRQFIPLSSTWLNRRAYEDLAEKEREYQARLAEQSSRASNVTPIRKTEPVDEAARAEHIARLSEQFPFLKVAR